ncbi:MAG: hypothetical protein C0476_08805 [Sphingomonas sp.]|nr:hypothetical protein [Sphingomonas sp.]
MVKIASRAGSGERAHWLAIIAILTAGLVWRLLHVNAGLPSLWDPDEPLFVVKSLEMLKNGSFRIGWYGHPGSTTIYVLALTDIIVFVSGSALGFWQGTAGFAAAIYANPGLLMLPCRLVMVATGIWCIWLTYLIGKRIGDRSTALLAALLLAIDPVHIQWSQVVRTDIQASAFMLAASLFAIDVLESGRARNIVLAGLMAGLACVTKWPAALSIAAPLVAIGMRFGPSPAVIRPIAILGLAALGGIFIGSPFLLFDLPAVFASAVAEVQPRHLGANGDGFFGNLSWYITGPLLRGLGPVGLVGAMVGCALAWRNRAARAVVLPPAGLFLFAICAQSLIWERWVIPLLPFASIVAAMAIRTQLAAIARSRRWVAAACIALVIVPPSITVALESSARAHPTRTLASQWVIANVPRGKTVLVESIAMDLVAAGYHLRYPVGRLGCVDAEQLLAGRVDFSAVSRVQGKREKIALGTIDPGKIESCWADYAIFNDYDRFARERVQYPVEFGIYQSFVRRGSLKAVFKPAPGKAEGPVVHVLRLTRPR